MIPTNLILPICVLLLSFFLYTYFIFGFIDTLLENPRLKTPWYRIPLAVVNMLILLPLTLLPGSSSMSAYLVGGMILFVEFSIFYRDKLSTNLFCASSCILHVMALRSICVALFALFSDQAIYHVTSDSILLIWSTAVTFFALNIAIFLVSTFISAKNIKIIYQHKIHLWFMVTWMSVFNIYLFCDAIVYSIPKDHPSLIVTQILAPIAILIGLYIVLFFSFKTSSLLGYKEKSEELQHTIDSEQQYREVVTRESLVTYEFNLSKNLLLHGGEAFIKQIGAKTTNYSEMLIFLVQNFLHPDDVKTIAKNHLPQAMLEAFDQGKSEHIAEYRSLRPSGDYFWVRATTNLVKDNQTKEIMGFTYIKDIDKEKRRQIELENKAERDSLTGLYNKGTISMAITQNLSSDYVKSGALFIIDVDNFKMINDHLGHMYGDAVLCELAEKLKDVFLKDALVGRIGGDEFMAFMKNLPDIQIIGQYAQTICNSFFKTYKGQTGKIFTISASIGIALFPKDGMCFEDLYKNADFALYAVKSAGKNAFRIYDGTTTMAYESARTEIDTIETNSPKNFKENRIEYVFKILYASDNPITAIHGVLELVTSHFKFDRGYIFETSRDGTTTSNTYEWCREGIASEINNLQNIPILAIQTANASFYKTGMFIIEDLDRLEPLERAVLKPQGIKSMFQFGLFDRDKLLGFIGFDNCTTTHQPNNEESNELLTICNILATFFVKQRLTDYASKNIAALTVVMNSLDSFTYVVERGTFHILFMNEKLEKLLGSSNDNLCCYYHFRGNDEPCPDCPIFGLSQDKQSRYVCEVFNQKFNMWTETTASHIDWIDTENAYLVNCLDITKYKV